MQTDDLRNLGIVRIGDNCRPGEQTTIVVVGVPRSGTSMIASVLKQFGVHLGDEIDTSVFEDRTIAKAVDSGDMEAFRTIVEDYNASHRIWGFKRPKAFSHLDEILKVLRNPRIVVTMRDCVAIAVRNSKSVYHDEVGGIRRAAQATLAAIDALGDVTCPMLMVSYEKAITNPKTFARQLASFCGLAPSPEMIQDVVNVMKNGPELYLKNARLIYDGSYSAEAGHLKGWIMSNSVIPEIEIRSSGKVLKSFRPDLPAEPPEGADMSGGMRIAGFEIAADGLPDDIVLQVKNTVFQLQAEPAE